MTILISLGSFFLAGGLFMVVELIRAPEGVEDETGFHVVAPVTASRGRHTTMRAAHRSAVQTWQGSAVARR